MPGSNVHMASPSTPPSERPTLRLVLQMGSLNFGCIGGSGLTHKTTNMNAFLCGAIRRLAAQHEPATAAPVRGDKGRPPAPIPGRSCGANPHHGACAAQRTGPRPDGGRGTAKAAAGSARGRSQRSDESRSL